MNANKCNPYDLCWKCIPLFVDINDTDFFILLWIVKQKSGAIECYSNWIKTSSNILPNRVFLQRL